MADKRKSAAIINSGSDSDSDVSDSEFQVSPALSQLGTTLMITSVKSSLIDFTQETFFSTSLKNKKMPPHGPQASLQPLQEGFQH